MSKPEGAGPDMRHFELTDLKRIAQAAVYWEPAWEAVMPNARRGNKFARSNYLDNRNLARKGFSRQESLQIIEDAGSVRKLLDQIQPREAFVWRNFGFNFVNVLEGPNTIEFRRGACSVSTQDVRMWVAVALLASIRCNSLIDVQARECTVAGLERFLFEPMDNPAHPHLSTSGVFARSDIQRLFEGNRHKTTQMPKAVRQGDVSGRLARHLHVLMQTDVGR
ncbi:MAG: hypothetical protein Q9159_002565 [Coniocarpon cinnabarinum]